MKKIILLICFVLIVITTNAQITTVSLNGIPEGDAQTMIKHYQANRGQDKNPTRQSIWFDSATFKALVDLLDKERISSADRVHITDGIRIYFASEPGTGPGRLRNTVVIVSTRYLKDNPNVMPSKQDHQNYYEHDASEPFIKAAVTGKIYKKGFIGRGERLYKPCKECSPIPCNSPGRHYIDMDKAQQMVQNFGLDTMKTNSEWFDLDLLRTLANDTKHDGIRIYFARHVKNEAPIDGQKVDDREAFILVTTQSNGVWPFNDHKDYFDCNTTKGYFNGFELKHGLSPLGGGPGGQDNGELCPDNCE